MCNVFTYSDLSLLIFPAKYLILLSRLFSYRNVLYKYLVIEKTLEAVIAECEMKLNQATSSTSTTSSAPKYRTPPP